MTDLFVPAASVRSQAVFAHHIVIAQGGLLCRGPGFVHDRAPAADSGIVASHYLGELHGAPCGVHLLPDQLPIEGCEWRGLRSLLGGVDEQLFSLAGRALQVVNWDRDHRFCGRCGAATEYHSRDRARVCSSCELAVYPRISPCVIMLVTRGDQCLLARHARGGYQRYTALAGFIEPGENTEQALAREVHEEVGLQVAECRYIGSQSWPFPGQLMLGYLAEWGGGELRLDPEEIAEARWFHRGALPEDLPPPQTLSRQLIEAFARPAG